MVNDREHGGVKAGSRPDRSGRTTCLPVTHAEWIDNHGVLTSAATYARAEADQDTGLVRKLTDSSANV